LVFNIKWARRFAEQRAGPHMLMRGSSAGSFLVICWCPGTVFSLPRPPTFRAVSEGEMGHVPSARCCIGSHPSAFQLSCPLGQEKKAKCLNCNSSPLVIKVCRGGFVGVQFKKALSDGLPL
jgi:hypothetical protein